MKINEGAVWFVTINEGLFGLRLCHAKSRGERAAFAFGLPSTKILSWLA
jgi:hypothetical protein